MEFLSRFFKEPKDSDRLRKAMEQERQRQAQYLTMAAPELSALSDPDLVFAAWLRIRQQMNAEDSALLTDEQLAIYVLFELDGEIHNGGLCQFFANSSRRLAPLVSQSLSWVGAEGHRALYDDFLEKNQINAMDLTAFCSETAEEFLEKNERYPFHEFDSAYYELPALQAYLARFIRENIAKF